MAKPLNEFGGWLRFFQVTCWLTVVVFVVNVFLSVAAILKQFSLQRVLVFSVLITGIAIILSLLWKVLRLLKVKSPEVPAQIIKKILLVTVFTVAFSLVDVLSGLWLYQTSPSASSLVGLVRPIVWYLIWSTYFRKSKRVQAHYGVNASHASEEK